MGNTGKDFHFGLRWAQYVGHACRRSSLGLMYYTASRASRLHFLLLDLLIFILQLVTVYVAWETGHRDSREPDPLEPVEGEDENTDFLGSSRLHPRSAPRLTGLQISRQLKSPEPSTQLYSPSSFCVPDTAGSAC
ncbi:hypothetical protein CALCODRAFT_313268 [Calocera cornea HHB12733]|uniref:DUF1746 domain-containing protein n=1 Tax=Calocera cornea HHB12733 TaxID=1353952 RepID=A0A165FDW8_9BASI|nr:hypothetical protein CALCODRAFT_313268 [Calocera cornea HHB12733]